MPRIEDYVMADGQVDWDTYYVDVDAYWGAIVDRLDGHHWLATAA